jgi:acetyl-CoA acetyltransferase
MAAPTVRDNDVYIVGCVRTPIGRGYKNGMFHNTLPVDLLAMTLDELTKRTGVAKGEVEDVITGVVTPMGEQGGNIGRFAALKAGFPVSVPSVQLNRMCGTDSKPFTLQHKLLLLVIWIVLLLLV